MDGDCRGSRRRALAGSRPLTPPVIFFASAQGIGGSLSIFVRTSLDEKSLAGALRTLLHDANPTVPFDSRVWRNCFRMRWPIRGFARG